MICVADETSSSTPELLHTLSRRETEVLEMTALGLTNGQVGARLSISVHAVKFHLASVYRKLGVANRTEAAVAYLHARPEPPETIERLAPK
jgi:two-component system nitrate/nitrite response regulator NarL